MNGDPGPRAVCRASVFDFPKGGNKSFQEQLPEVPFAMICKAVASGVPTFLRGSAVSPSNEQT